MPQITDNPPVAIRNDLAALRAALDQTVPAKDPHDNLLIATWNIRAFASVTREWTAGANDSPKRDLRGLLAIAEITSRFDVIAVQEVQGNLRALRDLMSLLGDDWSFLMTDVTLGDPGNSERLAFVFDRRRVQLSGLAAELVVPAEWMADGVQPDALQRQFARTPYAVSFRAGGETFILVTLHVDFGNGAAARIPELRTIARFMADWARRVNRWHHNFIALGDFNIDRQGSALWQAFVAEGLTVPNDLLDLPRTIFSDVNNPADEKFYDQIAWFATTGQGIPRLSIPFVQGGFFDFLPHVYRGLGLSRNSISFRVSDHYPLWVEFFLPQG